MAIFVGELAALGRSTLRCISLCVKRMGMKRVLLKTALFACCIPAIAADIAPLHQQTSPVAGARFEMLQSTLVARLTFRLDRFAGRVWQLVRTKDDDNVWEETPVVDLKIQPSGRARFQLFTSGLAARHTFLLDGDTGKTWQVVTAKRKRSDGTEYEYQTWQPFAE